MKKPLIHLMAITALTFSALSAFAQESDGDKLDTISERLSRIENRIQVLERKVLGTNSDGSGSTLLADHEVRISAIEEEASKIYGKTEEVANAIQKLAEKMDMMAKDVEVRLQDLEKKAMSPVKSQDVSPSQSKSEGSTPKKSASAKDEAVSVPGDIKPDDLYNQAYDYMTKSQYATAEEWFKAFTERYNEHSKADNAWYWLGEMHLVQDRPGDAVIAFSNGLKAFPSGNKAPANLLKMGVAFERMGKKDLAKSAWEKLLRDFPGDATAQKAKKFLSNL